MNLPENLQIGDVVSCYLPVYTNPHKPGPELKRALILALEKDAQSQEIKGAWLVRFSARTHVLRPWEYKMEEHEAAACPDLLDKNELIIRTNRLDLIPFEPEWFGETLISHGNLWQELNLPLLAHSLQMGRNCPISDEPYGPRRKLTDSVVITALPNSKALGLHDMARIDTARNRNHNFSGTPSYIPSYPLRAESVKTLPPFQIDPDILDKLRRPGQLLQDPQLIGRGDVKGPSNSAKDRKNIDRIVTAWNRAIRTHYPDQKRGVSETPSTILAEPAPSA